MPIYEIEGKRVQTDTPLSESEIDEIAASVKKPSTMDYLVNQAKKGLSNLPSLLTAGQAEAQGAFAGSFESQPELAPLTSSAAVQKGLGVKEMKPQSVTERYAGAAVEAAVDPLGRMFPGSFLGKTVAAGLSGLASEAGGDTGDAVERKMRNGESSGMGRVAGSVFGAMASPLPGAPVRVAAGSAGNVAGQVWDKYKNVRANPDAAADSVAVGSIKRLLEQAATAGGVDKIENILGDLQKSSQYVTGKDAPLLVAASKNPVLWQELVNLARTSPQHRAKLQQELENIALMVDKKADTIFGLTNRPVPTDKLPLKVDNAQKRIDAIDGQLAKVSDPMQPSAGRTDTGEAIENLVRAKENAARSKFKPEYEGLRTEAREQGVSLPEEASQNLVTFIEANKLSDVFGKGTKVDRLIQSTLSKTEKAEGIEVTSFKAMSFDDVDSLKRAINSLKRDNLPRDQQRKVEQLEDYMDGLREQHIPEWSTRLKDIDKKFYQEVGVPFGAQSIKDVDAAKYASRVAPIIVKDRQSLRQFLKAVGDDGVPVAENALLARAYETTKEGMVNPAALSKFIEKNKEVLNEPQMARVKEVLTKALTDDRGLRLEKAKMDEAFKEGQKRVADNFLNKTDTLNYGSLLNSVISDPAQRAKTLKNIRDLSPEQADAVRGSLRAELVQKARTSPEGAMAFLSDRANKAGVDAVMGPQYLESLKKIAALSDSLKKIDIDKMSVALEKSQMDAIGKVIPGLDVPYVASTLRDRISSNVQKGVRLLSRISVAQTQAKYNDRLFELFTDPQGAQKMANVASQLDFKIKNPMQLNKVMGTLFDSLPSNVYIGLQGAQDEGQSD